MFIHTRIVCRGESRWTENIQIILKLVTVNPGCAKGHKFCEYLMQNALLPRLSTHTRMRSLGQE